MNRSVLIPRRKAARANWIIRTLRCISNYLHYRKQGICHSIAWATARNTL